LFSLLYYKTLNAIQNHQIVKFECGWIIQKRQFILTLVLLTNIKNLFHYFSQNFECMARKWVKTSNIETSEILLIQLLNNVLYVSVGVNYRVLQATSFEICFSNNIFFLYLVVITHTKCIDGFDVWLVKRIWDLVNICAWVYVFH
jgi:hypothetical protein